MSLDFSTLFQSASAAFFLVTLAEIGDKSQLVCMGIAARHRALPVILGATLAFSLLNLLATLFGAALASWLPSWLLSFLVGGLFIVFGILAFKHRAPKNAENAVEKNPTQVFFTTFLLIFLAEFGDKTQIAVAGLSSTHAAEAVWFGATSALVITSASAALLGEKLLKRLPVRKIAQASGALFLLFGIIALWHGLQAFL